MDLLEGGQPVFPPLLSPQMCLDQMTAVGVGRASGRKKQEEQSLHLIRHSCSGFERTMLPRLAYPLVFFSFTQDCFIFPMLKGTYAHGGYFQNYKKLIKGKKLKLSTRLMKDEFWKHYGIFSHIFFPVKRCSWKPHLMKLWRCYSFDNFNWASIMCKALFQVWGYSGVQNRQN